MHTTAAQSRWAYENIYGIYLTDPAYTWMAAWMAVTNRSKVQKRNLSYRRPSPPEDYIGSLEIFSTLPARKLLNLSGYVYLFAAEGLQETRIIDLQQTPKNQKESRLLQEGFEWKTIRRRDSNQRALVDTTHEPSLVKVDEWQVAVTNIPEIRPVEELVIQTSAIAELAGYISVISTATGEDYLLPATSRPQN